MDTGIGIRICEGCGEEFTPTRQDQRSCSSSCRKRLERRRKRDIPVAPVRGHGQSVTRAPDVSAVAKNGISDRRDPARGPRIQPGSVCSVPTS